MTFAPTDIIKQELIDSLIENINPLVHSVSRRINPITPTSTISETLIVLDDLNKIFNRLKDSQKQKEDRDYLSKLWDYLDAHLNRDSSYWVSRTLVWEYEVIFFLRQIRKNEIILEPLNINLETNNSLSNPKNRIYQNKLNTQNSSVPTISKSIPEYERRNFYESESAIKWYETNSIEPDDATKHWGSLSREHGKFGSHPVCDDYHEDSFP
ncbi:hypothetical protein Cylst_6196 [Cylindrospermum stagnale PCC 7417]|uniref:Uncharacterized protein n=1 Tax=Cylindrospermum stagnale PCC 7417 TaxID=56107 RepID=K9X927_9NOST|nr:hypothetical protein [Cylindrospermum stagnale]AFZ28162.1 hypothetical protein Cylst_6196 [Cylindrospermum stagnale PCC 7417]